MTGNSPNSTVSSSVQSETVGLGKAASIAISTGSLTLQYGNKIASTSFSPGATGDIVVSASKSVEVAGSYSSTATGGIITTTYLSGRGSDITLSTGQLNIADAGLVLSQTYGSGQAGNINLSVRELMLTDGANVSSTTLGQGAGGNVTVNASESVNAIGVQPGSRQPSNLSSGTVFSGNAGNLLINTRRLTVQDGGRVDSSTLTTGAAGSVTVNASDSVEVAGIGVGTQSSSQIISSAVILDPALQQLLKLSSALPSGHSGDVTINTGRLSITNGGRVNVQNEGTGNAGTIRIIAQPILLDRQGSITASTQSGEGGNIFLQGSSLVLRHNSSIVATAGGIGNGGNININAPVILGLENSDIIANAVKGRGGNIQITTQGIVGLQYRPQLTPDNDITASSEFGVNGTVDINNIGVDPNSGLVELPQNVTDPSQQIASGCSTNQDSKFVATGRGGVPQNPNQEVRSDRTWSDIRDISAYRKTSSVTAQIPTKPGVIVQATSWHRHADGKIELVADKSSTQVQQALTCAAVPKS